MDFLSDRVSRQPSTSRLANVLARGINRAFARYQLVFRQITQRANLHFVARDWCALHNDSIARLSVYEEAVHRTTARVRRLLGDRIRSRLMWGCTKAVYSGLINERDDWEIAETFFNSVTRNIFDTVGVDEEIEFVHSDYACPPTAAKRASYESFSVSEVGSLGGAIRAALDSHDLPMSDDEKDEQSEFAASDYEQRATAGQRSRGIEQVEFLRPVFYRGEHAYLMGRLVRGGRFEPLVLGLRNAERGIEIDAVLIDESDVSLLFSFARSYFQVDVERPFDIVQFVKSILPRKPRSEIYNSIGYKKHGKTELYRHALRHLARTTDEYVLAAGQRGMVMVVFTMPSYPVVFKIIKDEFDYPKRTTRQAVIDRYHLVLKHDRAGRLVDAQEYQYLTLDRRRFSKDLLDELLRVASQTVLVEGDRVVIKHCYAERRVTPLNVYLQEEDERLAASAVVDYGQAIKDLALTNIFPGDLMLKNFGVTRHRRIVFYDYDEVSLLTDCTFRKLPAPQSYDEELAAEPWYGVAENDVFPEEFQHFWGFSKSLGEMFLEHHADLLTTDYWLGVQRRLRNGELFSIAPYPEEKRLCYPSRHEPGVAL